MTNASVAVILVGLIATIVVSVAQPSIGNAFFVLALELVFLADGRRRVIGDRFASFTGRRIRSHAVRTGANGTVVIRRSQAEILAAEFVVRTLITSGLHVRIEVDEILNPRAFFPQNDGLVSIHVVFPDDAVSSFGPEQITRRIRRFVFGDGECEIERVDGFVVNQTPIRPVDVDSFDLVQEGVAPVEVVPSVSELLID